MKKLGICFLAFLTVLAVVLLAEHVDVTGWTKLAFLGLGYVLFDVWLAVFTKRVETIVIASKAILVNRFGKKNIIKATNGADFVNDNDLLIKWNSKKLDEKLKEGHTYKITSYCSFGGERIVLYADEIKSPVRKKTGKKSK